MCRLLHAPSETQKPFLFELLSIQNETGKNPNRRKESDCSIVVQFSRNIERELFFPFLLDELSLHQQITRGSLLTFCTDMLGMLPMVKALERSDQYCLSITASAMSRRGERTVGYQNLWICLFHGKSRPRVAFKGSKTECSSSFLPGKHFQSSQINCFQ